MSAPRGHTLVELLVALAVGAVALAAVVDVVARQRRLLGDVAAERSTRGRVREGADLLAAEMRTLAGDDGPDAAADGRDLRVALDSMVELRALVGAAPACVRVDGWTLDVARDDDREGLRAAWWSGAPQPGDTALVLDEAQPGTAADDRWRAWLVVDVGARGDACAATPIASVIAPGAHRLSLAGAAPLPDSLTAGTPVRVLRARRWSLYRATDLRWYLGMRERTPAGWEQIQPASGPYDRYRAAPAGGSGLSFGVDGAPAAPILSATLRASRRTTSGGSTARRTTRVDSLRVHALPRNGGAMGG